INQFGDRSWKKNAPNRLGSATARHYLASPTGRMRLRRRNPPKCFGTRTETKGVFPLPLHMFSFSLLLLLLLPCRPYAAQLPVNKQARTNFFADKRHGVCVETQNARPREPQHAPQGRCIFCSWREKVATILLADPNRSAARLPPERARKPSQQAKQEVAAEEKHAQS
ncbi:unnamed protein product, partial [Ectocarpus fasciculatus]